MTSEFMLWAKARLDEAASENKHWREASDCHCGICTRLNAMDKAVRETEDRIEREVRADEREQCCKDVCGYCDDGLVPVREEYKNAVFVTFDSFGDLMHYCWRHREAEHEEGRIVGCDASAIRERAYQEQSKGR